MHCSAAINMNYGHGEICTCLLYLEVHLAHIVISVGEEDTLRRENRDHQVFAYSHPRHPLNLHRRYTPHNHIIVSNKSFKTILFTFLGELKYQYLQCICSVDHLICLIYVEFINSSLCMTIKIIAFEIFSFNLIKICLNIADCFVKRQRNTSDKSAVQ